MENKDITWMVDCVIILLFTLCLFCCSGCEDSYAETTPENEMLSSSQTDSLIAETWGVNSKQVTMVNVLLNNALQVEQIYIDLLLTDSTLVDSIESPSHYYCLECKMKALKFCYNHRLWSDTVGEWDYADNLEFALSEDSEFSRWWNRIQVREQ